MSNATGYVDFRGEAVNAAELENLATRARRERKRRGWTQKELAREARVSLGTVSNFERRVYKPQPEHLRAILRTLNLEAESGDARAEETRESWPVEVRVFLDVIGVFLTALPEERRGQAIRDITREIVATH